MKITKVNFKRVFSYGNYENVQFGYEAEVADGEKPEAIMMELNLFAENEYAKLLKKDREKGEHRAKMISLYDQVMQHKEDLKKIGNFEDLPF